MVSVSRDNEIRDSASELLEYRGNIQIVLRKGQTNYLEKCRSTSLITPPREEKRACCPLLSKIEYEQHVLLN